MFVLEPDCEPTPLPALDLDTAYHASRRGNNPGDLEGRLPGPGCQSESLRWPHALFESLEKQGRSFFGHDFSETARSCISQGLLLTTDYSGIGCPEESLKQLVEVSKTVAWNERQEQETGEIWGCQRAGDLLPYCRRVLLDHTHMFQPQCVHGNMLDRCPRRLLERLERLRVRAAMSLHTRKEMGLRVDASYTLRLGRETVRKAADFMFQGLSARQGLTLVAHCFRHGQSCRVIPPAPEGFAGLRLHIAGVNCYDWSSMGHTRRWLGESLLPFMQWCRERFLALEDIIIVECVCQFDSDLLAELFAAEYTLDCVQFSPTLFGEPVERQRKYMVMLRRGRVEWHPVIAEKGVQDSFLRLFARTLRSPARASSLTWKHAQLAGGCQHELALASAGPFFS